MSPTCSSPHHRLSPLGNAQPLSGVFSRKRHCDRNVIPPSGWFTLPRFGHFASTSLFPLAPPRFAARLQCYYGNSDSCRVASTDFTDTAIFAPLQRAIFRQRARAIVRAVSLAAIRNGSIVHVLSLVRPPCLSPSNFRPFHPQPPHGLFAMIDLPRYIIVMTCPRLSSERLKVVEDNIAQTRVRPLPGGSPLGLAESGSLSLRTGLSPRVALHLFLRKRSYLWIQAGNVCLEGTYTLLFKRLHRRTSRLAPPRR